MCSTSSRCPRAIRSINWTMCLLSPHSADHIVGWADAAMNQFIENFERFRNGQPLENVVDKKAGY